MPGNMATLLCRRQLPPKSDGNDGVGNAGLQTLDRIKSCISRRCSTRCPTANPSGFRCWRCSRSATAPVANDTETLKCGRPCIAQPPALVGDSLPLTVVITSEHGLLEASFWSPAAVAAGVNSDVADKLTSKIARIVEADGVTDAGNASLAVAEKLFRCTNASLNDPGCYGFAGA